MNYEIGETFMIDGKEYEVVETNLPPHKICKACALHGKLCAEFQCVAELRKDKKRVIVKEKT